MKKYDKKAKSDSVKKDRDKIFFLIDSPGWRRPENLDIGSLRDILDINNNASVFVYKFKDQDTSPELPPNTYKVESSLHLAADDNFLYVWSEKNKRWKRIPLSDF